MSDDRPGSVLVLTNSRDSTADVVLRILAERRVPVVRVDPAVDLHSGASLTARYDAGGQRGTLVTPTRALDLRHVRSVWWRRPTAYCGPSDLDGQDAEFAGSQMFWGVGGILASLPGAHYMNHPWQIRNGEYKPAQLAAALRCGLRVPETTITLDPAEARRFCAGRSAVYKPLWNTRYRDLNDKAQQVWVRVVDPADITDRISACPHLFQAKVEKIFDVRLTAVGTRLFATRITSPELDWRRRQDLLTYEPISTPDSVAASVARYLSEMGLVFGAFDFAVTADGDWYFLECNPSGQWAWFPAEITTPIARAIADELESPQ
ncbi:ATP-grasp ribosomal peptide maturase [Kitasatospora sp. LaBMicrA B282]|uniref:ATP-grasp ribosomal peptide maturase n=1 Tax=Kitasatospora sp. LaBMicrA B282 TaxID=3420949 RepID=UPI003D13AEAB